MKERQFSRPLYAKLVYGRAKKRVITYQLKTVRSIFEWLEKSEIWIERTVNEDIHKVNIRPHVANMILEKNKLTVSTRSVNGRNARVNEILGTIFDSQEVDWKQFLVQRIGQFEELGNKILSPFEEV